jgi:hypothetical protein
MKGSEWITRKSKEVLDDVYDSWIILYGWIETRRKLRLILQKWLDIKADEVLGKREDKSSRQETLKKNQSCS